MRADIIKESVVQHQVKAKCIDKINLPSDNVATVFLL